MHAPCQMAGGSNYLYKEAFWLLVHGKQAKRKRKNTFKWCASWLILMKIQRQIVLPLCTRPSFNFFRALNCRNKGLPINRGWKRRKIKVQTLLDTELVLEFHLFAAVFQSLAASKKMNRGKGNPSCAWQGFISHVLEFRGDMMIATFAWIFVAIS